MKPLLIVYCQNSHYPSFHIIKTNSLPVKKSTSDRNPFLFVCKTQVYQFTSTRAIIQFFLRNNYLSILLPQISSRYIMKKWISENRIDRRHIFQVFCQLLIQAISHAIYFSFGYIIFRCLLPLFLIRKFRHICITPLIQYKIPKMRSISIAPLHYPIHATRNAKSTHHIYHCISKFTTTSSFPFQCYRTYMRSFREKTCITILPLS